MDLSNPGIVYALLVIPSLFGMVLIAQGVQKIMRHDEGGGVSVAFGVICLALVGVTYFMFIR